MDGDPCRPLPPRRCPVCGKPPRAESRPFCSVRCAQVDLGRWLSGGYAVPGAPPEPPEEEG